MKRLLALLLAVVLTVSFVACSSTETEDSTNKEETTEKNPADKDSDTLSGLLNLGTGSMSVTAEGALIESLKEMMGLDFNGFEVSIDENKAQAALLGSLNGKKLSDAFYFDGNSLVLNAPNFVGGSFGVNFGTVEKDWKDSIFNPANGSDFAISEESVAQIEEIKKTLESLASGDMTSVIPGLDMEAASETIIATATSLFEELSKISSVEIGTEGTYNTSSFEISADQIADAMEVIKYELEDNKDLKDLFNTVATYVAPGSGDLYEMFIEELEYAIEEFEDTFKDAELNLSATLKQSNDGKKNKFEFIFNVVSPSNEEGTMRFTVKESKTNTDAEFAHKVSVEVDLDGVFEEAITTSDSDDTAYDVMMMLLDGIEIDTSWNKTKGYFSVEATISDTKMEFDGSLKISENSYEFVFKKFAVDNLFDTSDMIDNITFKVSKEAPKKFSAPKFSNALKMTEGQVYDMLSYVEKVFTFEG